MELFLTDEIILGRSKVWSDAMATLCKKENFKEIEFNEIESGSGELSDDITPNETIINNNNENTSKALVRVEDFEGKTSSDDFDDCKNETLAMMKEHQNKWEKCGMMEVLETFDLDKISKLVTPWIEKNKLDKSLQSTSVDEHIVHIEEHHHQQIHLASDDDSLHSLDTANYIKSSRKNKRSSCTTTTIKKFSYVKGSKRQLQKKYGLANFDLNKGLDKVFYEKYPENVPRALKDILGADKNENSKVTPPSRPKAIEYEPRSLPARRRRSRPLKRRSDITKRSVSSSSSSPESSVRPVKPKFRRSSKMNTENVNQLMAGSQRTRTIPAPKQPLNIPKKRVPDIQLPDSDDSVASEAIIDLTQLETSEPQSLLSINKPISPGKPTPELPKTNQGTSFRDETGFLGASIINSTALSNTNQPSAPIPAKKCLITPIKNNPVKEHRTEKNKKAPKTRKLKLKLKKMKEVVVAKHVTPEKKVPTDNSKILLYCPQDLEQHRKNLSDKRFYLTREYFSEMVGKKNSRRFLKLNARKFPFEFDCTSTIYFKVPEESGESASSDEDILYIFGREGKLIVEREEHKNND